MIEVFCVGDFVKINGCEDIWVVTGTKGLFECTVSLVKSLTKGIKYCDIRAKSKNLTKINVIVIEKEEEEAQ